MYDACIMFRYARARCARLPACQSARRVDCRQAGLLVPIGIGSSAHRGRIEIGLRGALEEALSRHCAPAPSPRNYARATGAAHGDTLRLTRPSAEPHDGGSPAWPATKPLLRLPATVPPEQERRKY